MLLTILNKWIHEDNENMDEQGWMWFLVDGTLDVWSVFHLLVVISIILEADVSYKRGFVQSHYAFLQFLRPVLFVRHAVTMVFGLLTMYCWYCCYCYHHYDNNAMTMMIRGFVAGYTWISSIMLQKFSMALIKLSPQRVMEVEREIEQYNIKNFQPPPRFVGKLLFGGLECLLRPTVVGLDKNVHVDKAALYVMNHSLLGVEMPLVVKMVYDMKNVFLRGLADHFHFGMPHGGPLRMVGAVNGTRENVDCLMKAHENVLVYPGGSREVMKHSTTKRYELLWKERLGFARAAIKHGYPIVPCAGVGSEDMMHIALDIPVQWFRKDQTVPLIWPIMPHNIQRQYFWFGDPIPTDQYKGDWKNDDFAREVRDKTKAAVLEGIRILQAQQAADPDRYLWRYYYNRLMGRPHEPAKTSKKYTPTKSD